MKKNKRLDEKALLHDPFAKWLTASGILYDHKNDAKNHYRASDDGKPDFTIWLSSERVLFIEFKTPSEIKTKDFGLNTKQSTRIAKLRRLGFEVRILDNLESAYEIIRRKIIEG